MKSFDPAHNNGHCQTRDGRKARILCTDADTGKYPIVALTVEDGYACVRRYRSDGTYGDCAYPGCDLVNIPEKRKYWVTLYTANGCLFTLIDNSAAAADYSRRAYQATGKFIATHEGEYDVE